MEKSILVSVKKMLGIEPEDSSFDLDIIVAINSYFMVLNQLGVGPECPFSISGPEEMWEQFLNGRDDLNSVKSYIWLKAKMQFDPSASSIVMEAMKQQASELEFRLHLQADDSLKRGGIKDGHCGRGCHSTLWKKRNELASTQIW